MKNSVVVPVPAPSKAISSTIAAIVPFYNEEKNIGKVIKQLLKHPLIDEIICVNDGSTDSSVEKLLPFAGLITVVSLKKNKGKGSAMAQGVKAAKSEIVAFFDADLTNLTTKHIDTLLTPIITKKKRAVLGYPTGGHFPSLFIDVTGERAYFREDLLPHLKAIETTTRFSVEYYLNSIYDKKDIQKVPLRKLIHLYKHEKYKAHHAIKETIVDIIAITQQFAKKEHLLPAELQSLSNFTNSITKLKTFRELKDTVYGVQNKRIKAYLKKALLYFYKI